jgi:hypothetical protein
MFGCVSAGVHWSGQVDGSEAFELPIYYRPLHKTPTLLLPIHVATRPAVDLTYDRSHFMEP